jgi:ATP-dependent protease ClpP protease subunit
MTILSGSTLTLYGSVGSIDFYSESDFFTDKDVRDALAAHGPGDIAVNLNSGGGIAAQGLAIYNTLKNHKGRITVNIDAIAASAASLIAMAGDRITFREGALLMIHEPSAPCFGTAAQHRESASRLETFAKQYRGIYAARTGRSDQEIASLMKAESWLDSERAIELGFATDTSEQPAQAYASFAYDAYAHAPDFLMKGSRKMKLNTEMETQPNDKPWAGRFLKSAEASGIALAELNNIVAAADNFEGARDALITAMANAHNANLPGPRGNTAIFSRDNGQTYSNPTFLASAIESALYAKMSGTAPEEKARDLMGKSLVELGVMNLEASGQRISWASRHRVAERVMMADAGISAGHATSDFPNLLGSAGKRVLIDAYKRAESPLKAMGRKRFADDFRAISLLKLSEMPQLEKVLEGGEIRHGSRAESKEAFKVETYGKIFTLTLQAIVNDDLGAFAHFATDWGRAAAESEANLIVSLFTVNSGNGVNLDDGNPIYTTGRGNKAAAGTVIDVTNLGLARQSMRKMKGLDGKTPINAAPKHLVVGPDKETEGEQVLAAIAAAQVSDTNPFSGKLTLHVEPRFSGNSWRLFADPADVPTFVYAYLAGHEGPDVAVKQGWNVLGTEFRCVNFFGCGATEWRGTYLNPGN